MRIRSRAPSNDASRMRDTLASLGFEVMSHANLTEPQMKRPSPNSTGGSAPGGTGLFYFAGHGLQTSRDTLLIPVDADSGSPARLVTKGIALQGVLDGMARPGGGGTNLVILDTCLNDPFEPVAAAFAPASREHAGRVRDGAGFARGRRRRSRRLYGRAA